MVADKQCCQNCRYARTDAWNDWMCTCEDSECHCWFVQPSYKCCYWEDRDHD